MLSLQGFKVLPLRFSETSMCYHELFVKEHSDYQSTDKPEDRTLFVLNVPPYATIDSIKEVFACAGRVENIIFEDKPTSKDTNNTNGNKQIIGFKIAYVIYENSSSLQNALKLTSLEPLSTSTRPVITGIRKWVTEYNESIYDHNTLQENVKKLVASYDKQIEKEKKQEKETDDEGWTVVKSKGRNPGVSRKESVEKKLLEKGDKNSKRKYLSDFYTFQKRESKMNYIAEMRKKYEQDKMKVNALKQARKFRPY